MPSTMSWIGNAQAVKQIDHVTPTNPAVGTIYTLTLNGKTITYTCTAATIANAVAGLTAAWNASTEGEMAEITAADAATYMTLTAKTKGVPFTSPTGAATGTNSGGVNEIQQVSLPAGVDTGTWQLTVTNPTGTAATTTGVAWNVSAADLQTALEALSNLAPADVVVAEPTDGTYTLTFGGTYANYNLAAVAAISALNGIATITTSTTTQGASQTDEIQTITLPTTCTGGTFTLTFGGQTTSGIPYNALGTAVDTALEFLSSVGAGNVAVTGGAGGVYTATFGGTLGGTNVAQITSTSYLILTDSVDVTTAQAGAAGTNEQQTVTPTAAGGTFTLTFSGYTTASISRNANAATVQAALEALTSIGSSNVTATGAGPWVVTFVGTMHSANQPAMTSAAYWTGAAPLATGTSTAGVAGTNEVQLVAVGTGASSGTYTLTFNGYTTSVLNWNDSAATVQAALEALTSIGAGNAGVVTTATTGQYLVTFQGTMASADQPAMTVDPHVLGLNCSITPATVTNGAVGVNEIQNFPFTGTAGGGYLTYGGTTSGTISFDDNAAVVQAALESIPNIGASNVSCSGGPVGTATVLAEFIADKAKTNMETLAWTNVSGDLYCAVGITAEGSPDQDEYQTITINSSPEQGTWRIIYDGQTTDPLNWNCSAADVDTAMEALSNIGEGDMTVTLNTGVFGMTFGGTLAATNLNEVTILSYLYKNATVAVSEQTAGVVGVNEVQTFTFTTAPIGGTYTLSFSGETTSSITWNANSATVDAALEALTGIGAGNIAVTGTYGAGFAAAFQGTMHSANQAQITANGGAIVIATPAPGISTTTPGVAGTNEIQYVQVGNGSAPRSGTFTLSFNGYTTSALNWNATAAEAEAALEALASIGADAVSVTKPDTTYFIVSFQGSLHSANQATITGDSNALVVQTPIPTIATTTTGAAGTCEVQSISMSPTTATSGTFTLTFGAEETAAINYNANASQVQTALEALTGIAAADCVVTGGPLSSGAFTLTFGSLLANSNVGQVSATSAVLTPLASIAVTTLTPGAAGTTIGIAASTANSGPNVWSVAANWSGATVPVTGDTVYFENCDVDCLYGIDQSAVTLAAMYVEKTYTGEIGLPNKNANGYREYRDKELAIGITSGWFCGEGGRYRINTGSVQTTLRIDGTGSTRETDLPAMLWRGTHASNVVSINKGSLGIALFAGETATVLTLNTGEIDSQDTDVDLEIGPGVTLTTFNADGGEIEMDCGCTTLTQTGGTITHTTGNITTLTVLAGKFYPRGSGTYGTTVVNAGGTIDNIANSQAPTFTTTTINGGSFYDPSEKATFTNAITLRGSVVVQVDSGQVQFGHTITLVRGNTT